MNILEKEIEDLIWHGITHDRPLLRKKGFFVYDDYTYRRQFNLGSYGTCDLLGYLINYKRDGNRKIFIHVIEIKREEINIDTLLQALKYCKGVERAVNDRLNSVSVDIQISLIGRKINKDTDFIFLPDYWPNLKLLTFDLDFALGLIFKTHANYSQVDEKFPDFDREVNDIRQAFMRRTKKDLSEEVLIEEDFPF